MYIMQVGLAIKMEVYIFSLKIHQLLPFFGKW